MALVLEQEYLIALSEFSIHFNDKITKSTIRQLASSQSTKNAKEFIGKEYNELTIDNFLDVTHWLFSKALSYDIFESKIHIDKENNSIMQFLGKLVDPSFTVNNQKFTREKLKDLKIFNSDVLSAFNTANEEYINFLTSQQSSNNSARNTINNNNSNNSNNSNQAFDEYIRSKQEAKNLVYCVNKLLRFKNHKVLFELHLSKNTTPHSLFFCRFPEPFFNRDSEFVEKYNKIIEKFQLETMDLIVESLSTNIGKLETEINTFKNSNGNPSINVNDFVSYVLLKEENALKNKFVAMKHKAQRCEVRKFEAKSSRNPRNSNNNQNESSLSNETTNSLNQSSNVSNYSSNSSRNVSWGRNQYRSIGRQQYRERSRSRQQYRESSRDRSNRRLNSHNRPNRREDSYDRSNRMDSSNNRSHRRDSSLNRNDTSNNTRNNFNVHHGNNRSGNSILSRYSNGRQ